MTGYSLTAVQNSKRALLNCGCRVADHLQAILVNLFSNNTSLAERRNQNHNAAQYTCFWSAPLRRLLSTHTDLANGVHVQVLHMWPFRATGYFKVRVSNPRTDLAGSSSSSYGCIPPRGALWVGLSSPSKSVERGDDTTVVTAR